MSGGMPKLSRADGLPVRSLGFGGTTETEPRMIDRAHRCGIDYFFFYSLAFKGMVEGLSRFCKTHREGIVVATGEESRDRDSLVKSRDGALQALGTEYLDIFYLEYVAPGEPAEDIDRALAEVAQWKESGIIRYVGASAHDRALAARLAETGQVDVLMHRYNMAHRRSEATVLPRAEAAGVPVVAFTCTRWGSLPKGHQDWGGLAPTAKDCYRFALSHAAVEVALTAPASLAELNENVGLVEEAVMSDSEKADWSRYGDLVYGDGMDAFETRWP